MHGKSLGIMEGRKDEERKEGRKGGRREGEKLRENAP